MRKRILLSFPAVATFCLLAVGLSTTSAATAREQVRIIGSALVTRAAADLARQVGGPGADSAITTAAEGAAFRAFCSGTGGGTPDAVGALRSISDAELKVCASAGVTAISDLVIGHDAVVIVRGAAFGDLSLSRGQIFSAIAAKVLVDGQLVASPYARWSEIDDGLPDAPIRVFGPAPGTDLAGAFISLVVEPGCRSFPALEDLPSEAGDICGAVRTDGAYVPQAQGLEAALAAAARDPGTVVVTTMSALAGREGDLRPVSVDGVRPDEETIAGGRYGARLDLHVVVKNAHRAMVPAFDRFLRALVAEGAIGPGGSLTREGLVPVATDVRGKLRREVLAAAPPASD